MGIVGRTGLATEDYDQTIVVSGNPSGPLAVAGALAAGPVIGAGVLVLSQLFKDQLQGLTRAYYHVTGPWAAPVVQRISAPAGDGAAAGTGRKAKGKFTVTHVAAIQMTSCANVARNLAVAGELLRQARAQGAVVAVLPENFAFMGRGEADKLAIAETHGSGPIQAFLAEQARMHGLWIVGGTVPLKLPGRAARCGGVPRLRRRGSRGRALRQDPPVRRGRARQAREPPGIEGGATRARRSSRSTRRRAGSASPSATTCAFPSSSANCCSRAPNGSPCRLRSRCRPAAPTGNCCCAPARSKTSVTWWRRRSPDSTRTGAKPTATR